MPHRCRLPLAVLLVLALGAAVAAPPAGAAVPERVVAIKGVSAAGPARYNRVKVLQTGPRSARHVLVLMPGTQSGAGEFKLVARDLVRRVPDLQVWSVDRRENAFDDTFVFKAGDPAKAFDYYLNFKAVEGRRFTPVDAAAAPFAKRWGLGVTLGDLRRVVLAARRGGRRVILGGHSLGASLAAVYAAWDFGGRPGHRDVDGLVFIDGTTLGGGDPSRTIRSVAQARAQLADLAAPASSPFSTFVEGLPPWAAGIFIESASLYARTRPDAASTLQTYPLVGTIVRPPFRLTNEALIGYTVDPRTSPAALTLFRIHSGRLAASGDPRGWIDDGITPVQRLAEIYVEDPIDGAEWFQPLRLSIDLTGARDLRRTALSDYLKLRPWHLRGVDVPVYAFETSLTNGRVIRGAKQFIARSRVPRSRSRLVSDPRQSHLDPIAALPGRNRFVTTVVPFLKRLTR